MISLNGTKNAFWYENYWQNSNIARLFEIVNENLCHSYLFNNYQKCFQFDLILRSNIRFEEYFRFEEYGTEIGFRDRRLISGRYS